MSSAAGEVAPNIVLASGSEVRQRLLTEAGVSFEVVPSQVDEDAVRMALGPAKDEMLPEDLAELLARAKLEDVLGRVQHRWVIAADQVLYFDGRFYDKPKDDDEARAHLLAFRGRTHSLHSAIVLAEHGDVVWSYTASVDVTMRDYSPAFVGRYLAQVGDRALKSVGCYQLEGVGIQLIEKFVGDYHTVLGLPLLPVLAQLRELGALEK
ncbi:MAG: Maf family nucleotide pyrophosphatase [Pseudomonadota bacterium]